ncbi:hypothetical protein EST38_g11077 [Candolleomyces aberdarensis]|uniref:Uncharacterized protein n=1 Tax=Candolleomyces aberdarensis TaxID=2316362 RepID=A0A4Q2D8J1_9AGAR|nr:hypothetical protein EST38_g11077 [Candolleomyces aberdarensis]
MQHDTVGNLSVHSGQAHSLAVCKALSEWFSGGRDRLLEFIGTPSKLKWGIHHQAHVASPHTGSTSAIADAFSAAWLKHSSEYTIGPNSKEYWTDECTRALEEYRRDMSVENHKAFRSAVKAAKREFFDERIEEIATTNKHPWDLMDWVKEHKNPPCEAIQFNGEPCHELGDLWDALHNTYNATSDRPVDTAGS